MTQFDYLSDYDFEVLVADLLGAAESKRFETFPRGRDGGVDLRCSTQGGLHVVQCKHYQHSSFAQLKAAAKSEAKHFENDLPFEYTFVTSRRLTAVNKAELRAVLAPMVMDDTQILGRDDLEAFLRTHPRVERSHVKLWLHSVAPLDHIVNADVRARTEALMADINAALPRYVQTASFSEAQALLQANKVVIVAGPPGIGKTTLARLLLLDSVESGFVPYGIQADVSEGWRLLKLNEPQIFFFDDFLGRTALFEGVSHDTRDLANFIRRINERPATRLILATREYVLRQAEQQVETLKWEQLKADRFALTLEKYTRVERARIFYNHMYFAPQVDGRARVSLRRNRSYLRVIDHRSYSPRLIEWMTGLGGKSLTDSELEDFGNTCVSILDNPESLWSYAFAQGLQGPERCLLFQMAALPRNVALLDLEATYLSAAKVWGLPAGRTSFERALKVLQDSFLHMARVAGCNLVSVLNPSLIDFLKERLVETPGGLEMAVRGARFFEQIDFYCQLARDSGAWTRQWDELLTTAIFRTLATEYDTTATMVLGDSSTIAEARLTRVAWWCQHGSAIGEGVRAAVRDVAMKLLETTAEDDPARIAAWPKVLLALREGGIDISELADCAKASLEARIDGAPIKAYEAIAELRTVVPEAFSGGEWHELCSRFEEWTGEALEDAGEWFDSEDGLYDFERTATKLGVALGEAVVDEARIAVKEMVSVRQERALERIDPDEWETDRDTRLSVDDDTATIDAMFRAL